MSSVVTVAVVIGALLLGIVLAWLPMRILLGTMARNIREFIQRQRDRRRIARDTPDRRKQVTP